MKIAYCGNFALDYSTETYVARTLEEDLDHVVLRLDETSIHTDRLLELALEFEADLFLYTRTWGFQGDGMKLIQNLGRAGIPTASLHLDLYWGLKREKNIQSDPFWRTKYVFTPDGGSADNFRKAGVNHHYLRAGVFRQECCDGFHAPEYQSSVAFVGALDDYHPEWPYRKELKDFLDSNTCYRSWLTLRGDDLNDLYASVNVVVGDSLCIDFKHEHYWSDRVYETIGRGGFLIMPYIKGLEEEFVDGETIVFYEFGDWDGLKQKIDYYLEHPIERERIRLEGQDWVRQHATYTNRMREMLNIIGRSEGW